MSPFRADALQNIRSLIAAGTPRTLRLAIDMLASEISLIPRGSPDRRYHKRLLKEWNSTAAQLLHEAQFYIPGLQEQAGKIAAELDKTADDPEEGSASGPVSGVACAPEPAPDPASTSLPEKPRRKGGGKKRRPTVRPHHGARGSGPITEDEAAKFLAQLDSEDGLRRMFGPAAYVDNDRVANDAALRWDGRLIRWADLTPRYRAGAIDRTWDPGPLDWERALIADAMLVHMLRWYTWTEHRGHKLLPRLAPYLRSITPDRAEGTAAAQIGRLVEAGIVYRSKPRTWRLTRSGRKAVKAELVAAWLSAADEPPTNRPSAGQ